VDKCTPLDSGRSTVGYVAEYDAGFLAGLLAASQVRAPPPGLALGPGSVVVEGGVGASAPEARLPLTHWSRISPTSFKRRCSSA